MTSTTRTVSREFPPVARVAYPTASQQRDVKLLSGRRRGRRGVFLDLEDSVAEGTPGAGGPGAKARPFAPQSVTRWLPVTLEDRSTGTTKRLKVTRRRQNGTSAEKILTINVTPVWNAGIKIRFAGEGYELPSDCAQETEKLTRHEPGVLPHH
ncbi:hypothetical protein BDK51DRAFT_34210 [Blyttiomyces helicus]|uniref:Chaperone DnaJ C-terminal domain-containing protein n=1 Tax=Blyttiomyces helicus TaxID=388810 RepID=A0A4P9W9X4_9FUNG|nr:hypothetical protein BDK51DRAFT_34210 [Blyttiomyces helicus]|eukprot:RKO89214.1 hypothetical protein BDK51DRAFT_34210 [Blyttiomyces helicus]